MPVRLDAPDAHFVVADGGDLSREYVERKILQVVHVISIDSSILYTFGHAKQDTYSHPELI